MHFQFHRCHSVVLAWAVWVLTMEKRRSMYSHIKNLVWSKPQMQCPSICNRKSDFLHFSTISFAISVLSISNLMQILFFCNIPVHDTHHIPIER